MCIRDSKNGLETLASKVFIDCTGDGDLAHMADVPMQPNPDGELQPSSYCFILSGVDTESELLNRCMYHNGINGPVSYTHLTSRQSYAPCQGCRR